MFDTLLCWTLFLAILYYLLRWFGNEIKRSCHIVDSRRFTAENKEGEKREDVQKVLQTHYVNGRPVKLALAYAVASNPSTPCVPGSPLTPNTPQPTICM